MDAPYRFRGDLARCFREHPAATVTAVIVTLIFSPAIVVMALLHAPFARRFVKEGE